MARPLADRAKRTRSPSKDAGSPASTAEPNPRRQRLVRDIALIAIAVLPTRRVARWGFKIGEGQLRVARGWLFRTDTIVPFVRVQHIDVTSGPVDKLFGLANLVVHTAGTHNSTVTLPGLSPERAVAIRDAIRAEIRADAE